MQEGSVNPSALLVVSLTLCLGSATQAIDPPQPSPGKPLWLERKLSAPEKLPTKADIPTDALPELRTLLENTFSSNAKERESAAQALGKMGASAKTAIPFLIRLLDDRTAIRYNAEADLYERVDKAAFEALKMIGEPAVQPCIEAIDWSKEDRLSNLIRVLGEIKDVRALAPLAILLDDKDPHIRDVAVRSLWGWSNPQCVPLVIGALKDKDEEVRQSTTWVLSGFRDDRVVPALVGALKDEAKSVRTGAAVALGDQKDGHAVPPLLTVIQSSTEDATVRYWATRSVGMIADPKGLDQLVLVLKDRSKPTIVRCGAAAGLALSKDRRFLGSLTTLAKSRGEEADLRGKAVIAIADLDGTGALPVLTEIAVAENEDDHVQCCAGMMITRLTNGAIDDVRVVEALGGRFATERHMMAIADAAEAKRDALRLVLINGKTDAVRSKASTMLKRP